MTSAYHSRMDRMNIARIALASLVLASLVLALTSCASKPDEPAPEGMLKGFEFGNRADMDQIRGERNAEIHR